MSDIAVVHMDLAAKGGGETVCMNVLEALQDDHEVTLLTLTEPDFRELNAYFDTSVEAVTVERAGRLGPSLHRRYGLRYYILQNALLGRYARRRADDFDLVVSTINELGLPDGSVEYVHFPFDWTVNLDETLRDRIFHPTVDSDGLYERLCTSIAGVTAEDMRSNQVLANSEWTADAVEGAYGVRPRVLYPPVDTGDLTNRPWSDREPGFVTVGRIERSKRVKETIRIVDGVRERGHETHLHVIGPTIDDEYGREVTAMADDRPYVHLEGEVSRAELVECICAHRYGIHGKRHEHFGMAVAELAAAGAVPFVPATGGQKVIVDGRDAQLYATPEEAVEKIVRVMETPSLQSTLRTSKGEVRRRFGRERFKEEFAAIVADALADRPDRRPAVGRQPLGGSAG